MDRDNPRGRMTEDVAKLLMERRPDRREIVELLGEPDFRDEPELMSYNLGMWSGFRMDYDSLDIYLDSRDRVDRVQTVQH